MQSIFVIIFNKTRYSGLNHDLNGVYICTKYIKNRSMVIIDYCLEKNSVRNNLYSTNF